MPDFRLQLAKQNQSNSPRGSLAMATGEEVDITVASGVFMVSAFLAMEPPDVVLSFARDLGGGSITEGVQSCIWRHCINKADLKWQGDYVRRLLKKVIGQIESSGGCVLDELYEQYAFYMTCLQDNGANNGNLRVLKTISFLFPNDAGIVSCPKSEKFEVQLQCSTNMLEGDTGCSIWPSSLFLSEFILSFPEIFSNKCCFEVGSGTGLVGICLSYVKASKVILSDGDLSSLANMKFNLELNHLCTGNRAFDNISQENMVHCLCLPWQSATDDDLLRYVPDIILGADVIYDPSCLPHLIRILAILLKRRYISCNGSTALDCHPVAYIASVIRNADTFDHFLALAGQANLKVTDLTENVRVSNLLPYLGSYQRAAVRLLLIQASSGNSVPELE